MKKILFLIILLTNFLCSFSYSYLPPIPKNYVKSYVFAFDGGVQFYNTNEKWSGYYGGLSFRNIKYFNDIDLNSFKATSNFGLKGHVYFISLKNDNTNNTNKNKNFVEFAIMPTLGHNLTNHLNCYFSTGMKIHINIEEEQNSFNNIYFSLLGEMGISYFFNDDIVLNINYQQNVSTKSILYDRRYGQFNVGLKITFR